MKVMTLKQFDEYMQEGHFNYSVFVILQLDEAATYLKIAKKHPEKAKKLYGDAYAAQLDALETAEMEQKHGLVIEPVLHYWTTKQQTFAWQIYAQWENYMAHIGRQLKEINFYA